MVKFYKRFVFITLFFVCVAVGGSGISDKKVKESAEHMAGVIKIAMDKIGVPGCSYVVVRKNKIIYTGTIGKVSIENGAKDVTQSTIFPISSLTKNITAAIVGALVDEGVINFDDPVRKYIPKFFIGNEDISHKFTIRDLISHRSGFHHFLGDSLWSCGYSKTQMIESLRYINNVSGFRKKYGYQNIIFAIIEDVITNATGKTYDELLQKYVTSKIPNCTMISVPPYSVNSWFGFFKYNMEQHGIMYAIKNMFNYKHRETVIPYSPYNGKIVPLPLTDFSQRLKATAGISMSINDLGLWLQILLNRGNPIVSQDIFDNEICSNQVEIKNLKDDNRMFPKNRLSDMNYGMGTFNAIYSDSSGKNGRRIYFHMGGIYGVCTFIAFSPEDDVAIGILANLGGTSNTLFSLLMTWQFFDECFGFDKYDWIRTEIEANEKNEAIKKEFHQDITKQYPGPHAELKKYTGIFTNDVYGDIKITLDGDSIKVSNNFHEAKLHHLNANIFSFDIRDLCENYSDCNGYIIFYDNDNTRSFDSFKLIGYSEHHNTLFTRKQTTTTIG